MFSLSILVLLFLTLVSSSLTKQNNALSSNTRSLRQTLHPRNHINYQEKNFLNINGVRNGYAPSKKEELLSNNFVIKVEADDPDPSDSIEYSFVAAASERPKFRKEDFY